MSDDNHGERELVLGNKQLLAIFFVAALLCGVFFAVGYVVGGNSAKSVAAVAATDGSAASTSEGKRDEPQQQSTSDTSMSAAPPSASSSADTGTAMPGAEPRMADNPAASGSLPPTPAPAPAPPVQSAPVTKMAPAAAPLSTPPAAPPSATGIVVSTPEAGARYWQIAAEQRPAADGLVQDLRERKLPAILATSSKPELFEILVGPYSSAPALADAKRKLTDLGFNGIVIHKQ